VPAAHYAAFDLHALALAAFARWQWLALARA